ncbi:hypothetical protein E2J97_17960 [Vibrio cholerae]|nr:hypothetical protein [Vibrio cholerae]
MRKLWFLSIFLSFSASANTIFVEGVGDVDLAIPARSAAMMKNCIIILNDRGEKEKASYFAKSFGRRLGFFDTLPEKDKQFAYKTVLDAEKMFKLIDEGVHYKNCLHLYSLRNS